MGRGPDAVISETTRLCKRCRQILPTDPPSICPSCDRVNCPPIAEWGPDLKFWLAQMAVVRAIAPHRTPQRRWEALLRSTVAGHTWGGRLYPMAIDIADAYRVAIHEAEKWRAAGCPPLFE
jgi:hypothetical protein